MANLQATGKLIEVLHAQEEAEREQSLKVLTDEAKDAVILRLLKERVVAVNGLHLLVERVDEATILIDGLVERMPVEEPQEQTAEEQV